MSQIEDADLNQFLSQIQRPSGYGFDLRELPQQTPSFNQSQRSISEYDLSFVGSANTNTQQTQSQGFAPQSYNNNNNNNTQQQQSTAAMASQAEYDTVVQHINHSLATFGFIQSELRFPSISSFDINDSIRIIDCMNVMLQQRQKDIEFRDETNATLSRMKCDIDASRSNFMRCQQQLELTRREVEQQKFRERSLIAEHNKAMAQLKAERDELQRKCTSLMYRHTQHEHKTHRLETQLQQLKDRLQTLLDKKFPVAPSYAPSANENAAIAMNPGGGGGMMSNTIGGNRPAPLTARSGIGGGIGLHSHNHSQTHGGIDIQKPKMEIINFIAREKGQRGTWKAGPQRNDVFMSQHIAGAFEDKFAELSGENSQLRDLIRDLDNQLTKLRHLVLLQTQKLAKHGIVVTTAELAHNNTTAAPFGGTSDDVNNSTLQHNNDSQVVSNSEDLNHLDALLGLHTNAGQYNLPYALFRGEILEKTIPTKLNELYSNLEQQDQLLAASLSTSVIPANMATDDGDNAQNMDVNDDGSSSSEPPK